MVNFTFPENVEHVKVCRTFKYDLKMIQNFPSKAYFANEIIVCVLSIFISVLTILLNSVTIITFRSSTQLQKKMCYFLISVQSWNDLGIGVIVLPLYSALLASELTGRANCDVFFAFFMIFYTTAGFSVAILFAMNLERYISIIHPIYHRTEMTKKKVLVLVISISALFVCVSVLSLSLGERIMQAFSGNVFLVHFVSTIFLYTRIFLVGKAKFQQNQPRINASQGNPQIRENIVPIQPENDYQGSSSCNQGHSSSTKVFSSSNQDKLSDNREEQSSSRRKQSDNHGELPDNHGEAPVNQSEQSVTREEHSDNQGEPSDNHGEAPVNQAEQSVNREEHSDNHGEQSKNQGKRSHDQSENSDDQVKQSDNQGKHSVSQGKQSDNRRGHSNNQAEQSDNQGKRANNQDGRSNHQGRLLNNQNRKSEQEVSKKLKLAKSCLYVVICSFIAFILPTVFQPLQLSDFHEIVLDTWFTLFVLLNSTLDSLIFFWKNKVLRNEARKVLKNMFS